MSWQAGIEVAGVTQHGLETPSVVFHIARMVQTPVGIASSGYIMVSPVGESELQPFLGFVSEDDEVGSYLGPNVFADTPWMMVRHYEAMIEVYRTDHGMGARAEVGDRSFEVTLNELEPLEVVTHAAGEPLPFAQQMLRRRAGEVIMKIDGVHVPLFFNGTIPNYSPAGFYAR